ncbi:hypothetical protein MITS9509_03228 [Synechococcus sp. MIT S9509]|nr:hypothetical protein MITS9504_03187 [Synechococcus sp. MIT S9504]KZR88629.1 hypothetical protein MITS9509_03228 [Synechococcus sp. MIT S9509]
MVLMYRMQRREFRFCSPEPLLISNASPAFTILQEEVSMSSSSLIQGLLIAENAG